MEFYHLRRYCEGVRTRNQSYDTLEVIITSKINVHSMYAANHSIHSEIKIEVVLAKTSRKVHFCLMLTCDIRTTWPIRRLQSRLPCPTLEIVLASIVSASKDKVSDIGIYQIVRYSVGRGRTFFCPSVCFRC